jgi:hypothetical protein
LDPLHRGRVFSDSAHEIANNADNHKIKTENTFRVSSQDSEGIVEGKVSKKYQYRY